MNTEIVINKVVITYEAVSDCIDIKGTSVFKKDFKSECETYIDNMSSIGRLNNYYFRCKYYDEEKEEMLMLFNLHKISQELYENVFDKALSNFNVKENEKKYVFSFYTEGVLGIIKRWIDGDCKDDIELIMAIIERNTFANEKNNG